MMLTRATLLTTALLFHAAHGLSQTGFPNTCGGSPFPFAAIAVSHPVDKTCGLEGKPASPEGSHVQNAVKNNFCAPGPLESFKLQQLIDLQTANSDIPSGQGKEPTDRASLRTLGEGKLIRMKAFLIEAHHADLGNGESVNCNGPSEEDNDIHIAFGAAADTKECDSISGEISPHFRPQSWNEIGHFETFDKSKKKNIVNPALAARLQAHPYRITGQLFFDASHAVCPCGVHCNPVRASRWEIHPIYNIEVCKAGTACDEDKDDDWLDFDTWWNSLTPLHPLAAPHTHAPHEGKEGKKK